MSIEKVKEKKMKYKILFVDIDDTLLDFQKSEEIAIRKLLSKYINNLH